MSDIHELWILQQHYNNLSSIESDIEKLSKRDNIRKSYANLKKAEKSLVELENKIKEIEKLLKKNNFTLKDYDYQLEKVEKNLYQENISDLKQLNILNAEREDLLQKIEEKETETLLQMEELDSLNDTFTEQKKDYNSLRKSYSKEIKDNTLKIEELNVEAAKEKNKIDQISNAIGKETLEKYLAIKNSKDVAVVKVVDNKCSGCNMFLPEMTLDGLKIGNKIIYCENCHRILYLE